MHAFILRGSALLLLAFAPGPPAAGQALPRSAAPPGTEVAQDLLATKAFQDRLSEYVTLHRMLEGPPPRPSVDLSGVRTEMQQLARGIVQARRHARQGDLITRDVARLFRRRIAAALPPEEWDAVLKELAEDDEAGPARPVVLRVNMAWPAGVSFGCVPPQLLAALPPLPPELQYRIIGRSLVLWDHHADLIVDFLAGAFPT